VCGYGETETPDEMTLRHETYPSEGMADGVVEYAREHDMSVSAVYKEGIRRMAQDPDHPLEFEDTNE